MLPKCGYVLSDKEAEVLMKTYEEKYNKRLGEIAFRLYDTHGLPLEITLDILKKKSKTLFLDFLNFILEDEQPRDN